MRLFQSSHFSFIPFHSLLSCMFSSVFYVFFGELDSSGCKKTLFFFFFFFSSVEVRSDKLLSEPNKKKSFVFICCWITNAVYIPWFSKIKILKCIVYGKKKNNLFWIQHAGIWLRPAYGMYVSYAFIALHFSGRMSFVWSSWISFTPKPQPQASRSIQVPPTL